MTSSGNPDTRYEHYLALRIRRQWQQGLKVVAAYTQQEWDQLEPNRARITIWTLEYQVRCHVQGLPMANNANKPDSNVEAW